MAWAALLVQGQSEEGAASLAAANVQMCCMSWVSMNEANTIHISRVNTSTT